MTDDAAAVAAETPTVDSSPVGQKTFTQSEVDRIVKERVAKFADYDDVKNELASLQDLQRSELEKAQAAAAEAAKRAEVAEMSLRKAQREAVVARAAKDAHDPSEVARLLEVADDASDDEVEAAVADLLNAKPYLVRQADRVPTQPTPGTSAAPAPGEGLLTRDEVAKLDPREVAADPGLYERVLKSRQFWVDNA